MLQGCFKVVNLGLCVNLCVIVINALLNMKINVIVVIQSMKKKCKYHF